MYKAEQEIRKQFESISKTTRYILDRRAEIQLYITGMKSLCVLGCGSSFSVAKSTALQFSQRSGVPARAIAAGDLLVNFDRYEKTVEGSVLLLLSRSGSTSELLMAAQCCRDRFPGIKIISICAVENAPVSQLAGLTLEIPWAFDHSVCQTQTVSNLYTGALLLCGIHSGDDALLAAIEQVEKQAADFCPSVEPVLAEVGKHSWNTAVVLADSSMAGVAEEGALAFKEICQRPSNFYHVLDVRLGPMVMVDKQTLVVILVSRGNQQLQIDLVADVTKGAGVVLVLDCTDNRKTDLDAAAICLPKTLADDISAIFMLYCIQLLCLQQALFRGVNPDEPADLDPWIKLEM